MKFTITFDISDKFAAVLDRHCDSNGSVQIIRKLEEIMSAIEDLRNAVNTVETSQQAGFEAVSSALAELATDIENLPQNADVAAEASRLSGIATTISEASATFAQTIRDAVPTPETPTPETPAPTPEEPA